MALIKCPECGKEISDKASSCPNCGCPSSEFLLSTTDYEEKESFENNITYEESELDKIKRLVKDIHYRNYNDKTKAIKNLREELGFDSISLKYASNIMNDEYSGKDISDSIQKYLWNSNDNSINLSNLLFRDPKAEKYNTNFNGIYRYSLFGEKKEVYCPRCGSPNCSYYKEQELIPAKTKTRYTANLNPLHPFTLANKKEKIIRKEQNYTINRIVCNDCGYTF